MSRTESGHSTSATKKKRVMAGWSLAPVYFWATPWPAWRGKPDSCCVCITVRRSLLVRARVWTEQEAPRPSRVPDCDAPTKIFHSEAPSPASHTAAGQTRASGNEESRRARYYSRAASSSCRIYPLSLTHTHKDTSHSATVASIDSRVVFCRSTEIRVHQDFRRAAFCRRDILTNELHARRSHFS
jgi:hypothetical protein